MSSSSAEYRFSCCGNMWWWGLGIEFGLSGGVWRMGLIFELLLEVVFGDKIRGGSLFIIY